MGLYSFLRQKCQQMSKKNPQKLKSITQLGNRINCLIHLEILFGQVPTPAPFHIYTHKFLLICREMPITRFDVRRWVALISFYKQIFGWMALVVEFSLSGCWGWARSMEWNNPHHSKLHNWWANSAMKQKKNIYFWYVWINSDGMDAFCDCFFFFFWFCGMS